MIGLLLALYPARWRRRYGEEFRLVLETRPLGPFDVADVLLGALDARFTSLRLPGTASGGHLMLLRLGGFGAVFGAGAWFIGLAAASGIGGEEGRAWMGVMLVGTLGLLAALVGLSAFQGHRQPRLAWIAFAIPALGTMVSAVGAAGMFLLPEGALLFGVWSPWGIWILGLLGVFCGSVVFAVATYRAAVLSRRAAATLGISSASAIVAAFVSTGLDPGPEVLILTVAGVATFAASWMWLGISALRRGPIRAVQPA